MNELSCTYTSPCFSMACTVAPLHFRTPYNMLFALRYVLHSPTQKQPNIFHFRQLLYVTYFSHHKHHARQAYTTRSRARTIDSPLLAARFEVLTVFWHITTCRLVKLPTFRSSAVPPSSVSSKWSNFMSHS
jgi:hypothetical protein